MMDKRFYKVISLFMKAILLIASFYFVVHKLTTPNALISYHNIHFSNKTISLLLFCFVLMFLNWGLEAAKWKLLIATYEELSWMQSLQSIFAGISISIFTPNRIGEFTGRIFFLKKANRLTASIRSIAGSAIQLGVTMISGIAGVWIYIRNGYHWKVPLYSIIDHQQKFVFALILVITLVVAMAMLRLFFFTKLKEQVREIRKVKQTEWFLVLLLSIARYIVFTLQYYLLILAFGVNIGFIQACVLITIIFFITSVIPSFALTEIVVRSAVAVYLFSVLDPAQPLFITSASLMLWVINLAIPALIGTTFMSKLQFFRTP
jgi:uncharacterized membrane protein YbhN (UPF0104 family)